MRYSLFIAFFCIISLTSCRKDFDTIPSSGKLSFSKTTVYLDTVFTNVSSSTYRLKVYNNSSNDITIPTISLAKGNASKYRIMVDGLTGFDADNNGVGEGKVFNNVELLAKDSMFVFIEATAGIADANPTDLLYTDEILFDSGAFQQKVNLVTLIQDAVFLYPERFLQPNGGYVYESLQFGSDPDDKIYGFFLDDSELIFNNQKPYVIYGYAAVPPLKTLTIQPGARIHFHDQSGIIVANTGSINVNGLPSITEQLENEIIFEGDRLEPEYTDVAGQWGTIFLTDGSTNNSFNYCTIKNASAGILIENQDATTVQIKNTQIYNSANVGILARNGNINGENIVINKAGQIALACTLGGTYTFKHCTFANYWTESTRQSPTVYLDNSLKVEETVLKENLTANIYNSIIYGPNNIEIGVNKVDGTSFAIDIRNNLIRFNDVNNQFTSDNLYNFINNATFNNVISNFNATNATNFKNAAKNQMEINSTSAAKGIGNALYVVPNDIKNLIRTAPFDAGAYNFSN